MTRDPDALRRSHRLRVAALYLGRPVPELTAAAVDTYLDALEDADPGLAAAQGQAQAQRDRRDGWVARLHVVNGDRS